jgi:hydrogenase maturation protease
MNRTQAVAPHLGAIERLPAQFSYFTSWSMTILGTNTERIVVLGVGNTLLKDEGVGVRVVEEFERQYSVPENVRVVDGGTQGLWLTPTLQETDRLIVVDAVLGDGEPGTLYRLEKKDLPKGLRVKQSAHDSDLVETLNLCDLLEAGPKTVVVLGVQPQDITPFGLELTERVAATIPDLVERVVEELKKLGIEPEKKFDGSGERVVM